MTKSNESGSEPETEEPITTPKKTPQKGSKKITEYEKERLKRIEENKERMKAMGLQKMANLVMASTPVSKNKGKKKVGLNDDQEYEPSGSDNDDDDDDDDEYCVKAIALSLQDSPGFLDAANKTPPQSYDANASIAEKTERNPTVRKDDSGKRKRKNMVTSRVQMSEDELILHFFQFDETGKGGINLRDLRRVAASHDFTWNDEEMEHMIQFFDSNEDGKLSLEDFTKIVELCNMRQGPENTEPASVA